MAEFSNQKEYLAWKERKRQGVAAKINGELQPPVSAPPGASSSAPPGASSGASPVSSPVATPGRGAASASQATPSVVAGAKKSPPPPVPSYFKRHEEQLFIIKCFILMMLIYTFKPVITLWLLLFVTVLLPSFIVAKARLHDTSSWEVLKSYVSVFPETYERESVLKGKSPVVTYALIIVNVLIYYGLEATGVLTQKIIGHLVFFPIEPDMINVPVSLVTSIFLHADGSHLWGNMAFLWAAGSVVERRVGSGAFLSYYIVMGVLAGLISVILGLFLQVVVIHSLGASGAIAGVMGIFAVRCYFKSMSFPVPLLGFLPFLNFNVKMNSMALIGFFFISDISSSIDVVSGQAESNVNHWAHIGGMVAGIAIAYWKRMYKQAVEERHLDAGMRIFDSGYGFAEGQEELEKALGENPDNVEALVTIARIRSKHVRSDEGRDAYVKAIRILMDTNPSEALVVYKEYAETYGAVEPQLLYRISVLYKNASQYEMSSRCLSTIYNNAAAPDEMRQKAMYQLAMMLEKMGQQETAMNYYRSFAEVFPESPYAGKARRRLKELGES
jgi:membrane associated rhomboid family serine protease